MKINMNNLSFPEQVKTVRFLQLTQTELAQQIGISYATVSRWERENRTPISQWWVSFIRSVCVTA